MISRSTVLRLGVRVGACACAYVTCLNLVTSLKIENAFAFE